MIVRDIPGYEGRYTVDENGNVYSLRRKKYVAHKIDKDGYHEVGLYKPESGQKWFRVHGVVLLAFVGPRPHGCHIDHIDCDIDNNNISNLRYVTPKENIHHSIAVGHHGSVRNSKAVIAIDSNGVERRFVSINEASRQMHTVSPNILACLQGRTKHACGYSWRYAE